MATHTANVSVGDFPHRSERTPALRVLVVEDELLIRWSIAETLADAGHTVIEAEDGGTALARLRDASEPIDVVLLDYRLPDSNDLSLLANIRWLSQSPVILMTAYGTPEVWQGAHDLGVYTVMNKPFEMRDVEDVVVRAHRSRLH